MLKASYTVEMAVIAPIVVFIIISLMYLTFYMHDRSILKFCAYYAGMESVFNEESIHGMAKEKVNELNVLTIRTTSTWTSGTNRKTIKYVGKYTAPLTVMTMFLNDEKIEEEAMVHKRMEIGDIYAVKVAKETIEKERK